MKHTDSFTHQQARQAMQLSLDGKLDETQTQQLEEHLMGCAECRAYSKELAQLDGRMRRGYQSRWQEQKPDDPDIVSTISAIHSRIRGNEMKGKLIHTARSIGFSAIAILLVAGLVWTIKTLLPIQNVNPLGKVTAVASTAEPSQVPESTSVPTPQGIEAHPTGIWIAQTEWGSLVLTMDELGTRVVRTDFNFSDWTCGSFHYNDVLVDATSWNISENKFSLTSTFDKDAQVHMTVNGTYDPAADELSGTWEYNYDKACSGSWMASRQEQLAAPQLPGTISAIPGVEVAFASPLPSSPESLTVYRQQLSEAVTAASARQVAASLWGLNAGVYSQPSEGGNGSIYVAFDGARTVRFINFPDQFIYGVGYVSPDAGSALMDSGTLLPFEEQVRIATSYVQDLGLLDMPYRTVPMETERGMVAFIPLLDGFPVIQEIGVDRSNIGWINVKVNAPGQVTMVQYSHHDFQPVGEYPILTAEQAWERLIGDRELQHSRYAVLAPESENTYQAWVRKFQPGQQAELYGWVNTFTPADDSSPVIPTLNELPLIGDTAGIAPANPMDVRFVHAWGKIQGSNSDGVALSVAGWEVSSLSEEWITGTISTASGAVNLVTTDRSYTLLEPPADIPDGAEAGVAGVVLEGDPPAINWRHIETGEIPFSYGASSTCGGNGSGGERSGGANFGAGSFSFTTIASPAATDPSVTPAPYQPGDELNDIQGRAYITKHLYPGGQTSLEVVLSPDQSSGLALDWGYSFNADDLQGIEQYNNLPIRISGRVEKAENYVVHLKGTSYEPVYPGTSIQAWSGTEQILTLDGQQAVLFTTTSGESYVLKSSVDFPPADANIIGQLGNVVEIEGYIIPDQTLGGYPALQDTAGSAQPDGVAESSLVQIWDHTQETSLNPGLELQGKVTIEAAELAYDATNLDRCTAAAADDPNLSPYLLVQPMWQFTGTFEDGRRLIIQVQALPDESLK